MVMNEQAQGQFVPPVALGEGKRFAHEATKTLAQSAVPAFNVAGFARALAGAAVGALWEGLVVGQPEIAARGAAAVRRRDALTQGTGCSSRTVAHEVRHHLTSLAAKGDPHPAWVRFGTGEAPEFVEFEHIARLGSEQRVAQRREAFGFFRAI